MIQQQKTINYPTKTLLNQVSEGKEQRLLYSLLQLQIVQAFQNPNRTPHAELKNNKTEY